MRFRQLRAACFGTSLAVRGDGREPSEERIARNERAYERLLKRLTEDQALACVNVALDLRPGWMRRELLKIPLTPDDQDERRALLTGLDALA
jgi:hypothetical protein